MNLQAAKTMEDRVSAADAANATRVLLGDLIDYAGLFPPASLSMAEAVANYNSYSQSQWKWMLGSFIVPAARLNEFEEAFAGLSAASPETNFSNWRLSALLGPDAGSDVARIGEFNSRITRSRRGATVASVEVKDASAAEITRLSNIIPSELATYFEVTPEDSGECIAEMSRCGRRAKIRTGGETADKFPTAESVVEFIRVCAASNVPFKATAGLHHPLRSVHRLTYRPDSPSGVMHGFVNVFVAAAFLRAGMNAALALELLKEESSQAFQFAADTISWREHRLSQQEIAVARAGFAVSFGSCSFTEPIDDLRSLHLL